MNKQAPLCRRKFLSSSIMLSILTLLTIFAQSHAAEQIVTLSRDIYIEVFDTTPDPLSQASIDWISDTIDQVLDVALLRQLKKKYENYAYNPKSTDVYTVPNLSSARVRYDSSTKEVQHGYGFVVRGTVTFDGSTNPPPAQHATNEVQTFLTWRLKRPGSLGAKYAESNIIVTENAPTLSPTPVPTKSPVTAAPTKAPTDAPTKAPTDVPTKAPTELPTTSPTKSPVTSAPVSSAPVSSAPVTSAPVTSDPVTSLPTKSPIDNRGNINPIEKDPNQNGNIPSSSKNKSALIATVTVCSCVLFIAIAAFFLINYRRRQGKNRGSYETTNTKSDSDENMKTEIPLGDDSENILHDIMILDKGQGTRTSQAPPPGCDDDNDDENGHGIPSSTTGLGCGTDFCNPLETSQMTPKSSTALSTTPRHYNSSSKKLSPSVQSSDKSRSASPVVLTSPQMRFPKQPPPSDINSPSASLVGARPLKDADASRFFTPPSTKSSIGGNSGKRSSSQQQGDVVGAPGNDSEADTRRSLSTERTSSRGRSRSRSRGNGSLIDDEDETALERGVGSCTAILPSCS